MAVTDFPYQTSGGPKSDLSGPRMPSVRDRMVPPMRGSRLWGWLAPLVVTIFGGIIRFIGLGHPKAVVFDETYYAKDGFSLITWLVERTPIKDADKAILAGNTDIWQQCTPANAGECTAYVV
ncbi:phospholipid carrier-dependent glycosyltransferase, partial [Nonomuraea glycinis]